jgi:hypothetical protein
MFQLIDELISKLDAIEDSFLIGLLEAKKVQLEDLKINIIPEDVKALTSWARNEIRNKVIERSPKISKINSMLDNVFNCKHCPLSKLGNNGYRYPNFNSEVCLSCGNKKNSLEWKLDELYEEEEKVIDEIVAQESIVEIIKMKSIIRNINRKIKKQ